MPAWILLQWSRVFHATRFTEAPNIRAIRTSKERRLSLPLYKTVSCRSTNSWRNSLFSFKRSTLKFLRFGLMLHFRAKFGFDITKDSEFLDINILFGAKWRQKNKNLKRMRILFCSRLNFAFAIRTSGCFVIRDKKYQTCLIFGLSVTSDKNTVKFPRTLGNFVDLTCYE